MSDKWEIGSLIKRLNEATEAYDAGKPIMSDEDWDDLYFKLVSAEKETGIIFSNSPTQKIHFKTVSALQKKEHEYKPMLSLDKTKNINDVENFVKGHDWFGMFKMDGLSCRLTYINGILVGAETRGDGVIGENILHNAKVIESIPKKIPFENKDESIIIDGEIICTFEDFELFKNDYANPRNFASGSIRLLNSKECFSRHLTFVAWDLIKGCEDIDYNFWRLEKLDDWGFITVPRVEDAETIDDAINILDRFDEHKSYPIDGYVFKFESKKYGESLGQTDHHFRNAIAFKFHDDEYETKLLDIELSLGRTGVLTPIAIFKPIEIDGAIIEKASLHNISVLINTLGQYPKLYQKIWITKRNQIIPNVERAIKNNIPNDHLIFPREQWIPCPVCGKETKVVESDSGVLNLICDNDDCEGKLSTKVEHYLGKKGLDVKGISKKTIEKLINWNWINSIKDIYGLEKYRTEWESKPGFGKTSVNKILKTIDAEGRHPELSSFISAIGIPLVGRRISKEIVKYYSTWEDFKSAVGSDWTQFEGFGPELNDSLNNFDYTEIDEIAEMIEFEQPKIQNNFSKTASAIDVTFCITGRLNSGKWKNRNELKDYIENIGGRVVNSVSSKVNYLINNDFDSNSNKNKIAKANNIPILTEQDFIDKFC